MDPSKKAEREAKESWRESDGTERGKKVGEGRYNAC